MCMYHYRRPATVPWPNNRHQDVCVDWPCNVRVKSNLYLFIQIGSVFQFLVDTL